MNDHIKTFLREYQGPPLRLMEVCGTHTAEISRSGIPGMLSSRIHLIPGPGCPVCVTVTDYIDRLFDLSLAPDYVVVTFGDLLRVPGSKGCLNDAKAQGGHVQMVYSPLDVLSLAKDNPHRVFVFAAVGFETTTPVYSLLLQRAIQQGIANIQLLTSLKTMPPVINWICQNQGQVDGFLAPGHVSVITGSDAFIPLAQKYQLPFVVAGFTPDQLLSAIYMLVKHQGQGKVWNLYTSAVSPQGNRQAQEAICQFFEPCAASWRGIGTIPQSGLALKQEYQKFDAGSRDLCGDHTLHPLCQCAHVLIGKVAPHECPLFGTQCTPLHPQGACMVSAEGSCYHTYNGRAVK